MKYEPVKQKYAQYAIAYSPEIDQLIKRKRALLLWGGTTAEWLEVAEGFLAQDCKANYAFCMWKFGKLGGVIEAPAVFAYVPEPEAPVMDYTDV